ncbi:baseplate hub protein [Paraburkholderia tuberum]|uniref:Uncharacterized protein n=1 Tax=Paraburkholderia tuberum TaxID=157910 RepID=A0A1H1GX96_9BURK|nr:hypothetical protein [Paraburkholderia tuberum]SDR17842.1 hypothetical protein SAMN05445850_3140 [Paraburkholderia tuberum]
MTFAQRRIDVQFALAKTTFPGGSKTLGLSGHRVQAIISNNGGGMAIPSLSLRIYGMKLADMGALATRALSGIAVNGDQITVNAGNVGGFTNTVFVGTVWSAVTDFSGSPEVSFLVNAQAGFLQRIQAAPANTYPGTQDVASIIGGLAKQAGFGFEPHNVTARLSGQYLHGSVLDQIERVATASQTIAMLDQQVLHIWPNGATPNFNRTVSISADTGMIGYPTFTPTGIEVACEWRPELMFGQKVNVQSMVPMASGDWVVQRSDHNLSTITPDGPWFSHLNLCPEGFLSVRQN